MNRKFNRKVAAFRLKNKREVKEWLSYLTDESWMEILFEDGWDYLENLDTEGNWCRWYKDGHKEVLETKFELWAWSHIKRNR